jgi:hypothetical protein
MIETREKAAWSNFDRACKAAEVAYHATLNAATERRDQVMLLTTWEAPRRVKAAAEARYARKVQAAQATRDEKCRAAEEALTAALDEPEKWDRVYTGE